MANSILVEESTIVRQHQRLRIDTPLYLVVRRPDKLLLVSAYFRDVCDDGVAVFALIELNIDSEVQLMFIPTFHKEPLRARAIVRNRRKYVYGLEFLSRDEAEEQNSLMLKAMLIPTGNKVKGSLDDRRCI